MKNINNHLRMIGDYKYNIQALERDQESLFQECCYELEIKPESSMGLSLFDYLYNGASFRHLQKVYKSEVDSAVDYERTKSARDIYGRFCRKKSILELQYE